MQQKMRERAKNAMKLIFEAARFEVEEVDEPLDLSAVRGSECILILCSDDRDVIGEFNQTNYTLMVNDREMSCQKLLFSLDESLKADNCVIWGVKEFVRYSGEAVLADILERELALSVKKEAEKATPATGGSPGGVAPEGGVTIPHLPIKVSKQNAEQIAGIQGSANLRFMPHWMYHFKSSGEQVFRDRRIPFDAEGRGAINGINGIRIEIDPANIQNTEIGVNAEVTPSHISREDAIERVVNETIERLTQKVRIKQEKGDAIFYEDKTIRPDRKNIAVELEEVYVPVWQIRGKKIVEVNAFTGEILSEPMDEGVEIL